MVMEDKFIKKVETLKRMETFWSERILDKYKRNILEPYWGKDKLLNQYSYDYKISKEVSEGIIKISKGNDLLIYIVMLTGLQLQINNYVNEDSIVNIPVYKDKKGVNKWLPVKCAIDKEGMISDAIKNCRVEVMNAYENQGYPLENIIKDQLDEDINNILGQICFGMSNIHDKENLKDTKDNKIYIYVEKNDEDISVKFTYDLNRYNMDVMNNFAKNYEITLKEMLANLKSQAKEVVSITQDEIDLIVNNFNNTKTDYPSNSSVKELFEEVVSKYPDNTAVVTPDCKISYKELDSRADKVCRLLRNKGIRSGEIVPIISDKDVGTLIGILGIVKSGAAYMPIDIEYPEERINHMLTESNSKLILGATEYLEKVHMNIEKIDIRNVEDTELNCEDGDVCISPDDLIYIMYTSGSTGKPKGVCIRNRSVVRLVRDTNLVAFDAGDKILQTGSMGFDAATFDIWGSLLNGLELHIQPKRNILDAKILKEYMWENKITTAFFTSALFNQLCNEDMDIFKYMKHAIVGGDVVSPVVVSKLLEKNKTISIYNGYGPTENTTFSTVYRVSGEWDKERSLPIGEPLSNSTCYIMNSDKELLPIGVIGELYVGGDGVANGYLNNVAMTEERFIEDPYNKNSKLYNTGDLARWLPDGNIEYFGRVDKQVKINGFRIEMDEIEKAILEHEDIVEAVIIDKKEKDNSKKLYAYVVSDKKIDESEVKDKLKNRLPKYMIPFKIHQVENIPLNVNGKVDKEKLLKEEIQNKKEMVQPRTHIEKTMHKIWSEVLGEESISIKDNFLSVGGDSIKSINVVSRLRKELEIEVNISDIFNEDSLEDISRKLEERNTVNYKIIKQVEKLEYYETSSAQNRMYVINQMNKESTSYNMPYAMISESSIDKSKLESCINYIVSRHESLRTSFHVVDNKIVQKVHEDIKIDINTTQLDCLLEDKEIIEEYLMSLVKPFDLEKAPLLRGTIVKVKDADLFFLDTHHIVVDGESFMILLRELNTLYNGGKIDYEPVQYKDYAYEENNKSIEGQKKYWLDKFSGTINTLDLPTDYKRPKKQSFNGNHISIKIDSVLRDKIDKFMVDRGVSKNMVYLSVLSILLSKYSRQEEIVIGIPSIGRTNIELQNTIGMFINTLATVIHPNSNKSFDTLVSEVKKEIINVSENQDYQFDKLVEDLNITRNEGRNPLFDIVFTFNKFKKNPSEDNAFKVYEVKNEISKFDMTVIVNDDGETDNVTIEYATDLFKEETINRIIDEYAFILEQSIDNSTKELKDLDLISNSEKDKILYKFNDTKEEYENDKSICEIFKEISAKYSENIALECEDRKITYKELSKLTNNIAGFLREKGINRNDIVAIVCKKDIQTIINILGIVMSGASYLPIDEGYPQERKKYMINDSKAKFVIANSEEICKLQECNTNCEFIDVDTLENGCGQFDEVKNISNPEDNVNIIYTSGSTGNPKGVCVRHKNIIRLVKK